MMIELKSVDLAKISQQFKALGDPTRLQILALLADSESCVCDIQTSVQIPANLLSHHLKVLREANLVKATRRGRWVDYKLNADTLEFLKTALPPSTKLVGINKLVCKNTELSA